MPSQVKIYLIVLLVILPLVCICLPVLLSLWNAFRAHTHQAPLEPRKEDVYGALLGCLGINLVLYSMYRAFLPKSFFYLVLAFLDGLCISFVLYGFVVSWLYKRGRANRQGVS